MDALTTKKNEIITLLQENQFDHLSKNEQSRLRDYFNQILHTLQDAAESRKSRQP